MVIDYLVVDFGLVRDEDRTLWLDVSGVLPVRRDW